MKSLPVAVLALAVALGLAACGGGGDSSTGEATGGAQAAGGAPDQTAKQGDGNASKGDSGSGGSDRSGGGPSASEFVPKQHSDSGGGSAQFRVKGGDNSVQEFGEEADTSEFDEAAATLHNFLDARAEGNWAAACQYMSRSITKSFERLASQGGSAKAASCAEILASLINPAAKDLLKAEAEKADVGSLRIENDRAFVIYTGTEGTVLAMPMADEGGAWKVASLAGTPLS